MITNNKVTRIARLAAADLGYGYLVGDIIGACGAKDRGEFAIRVSVLDFVINKTCTSMIVWPHDYPVTERTLSMAITKCTSAAISNSRFYSYDDDSECML